MPREIDEPVRLDGLVLPEARTGHAIDLGALAGRHLLTAVRHRF